MTEPINLNDERNKRLEPDAEFICRDDYGRKLYRFGVEYQSDEYICTFYLWAYSWEDAEAKLACIQKSAKIYGQIYSEFPV